MTESDLNFITRLAKQYDCTAKVANNKLIVLPRQGGVTASGKAVPVLVIKRSDVSRWQFRLGDDNVKNAVKAAYADKNGDLVTVQLDNNKAEPTCSPSARSMPRASRAVSTAIT